MKILNLKFLAIVIKLNYLKKMMNKVKKNNIINHLTFEKRLNIVKTPIDEIILLI